MILPESLLKAITVIADEFLKASGLKALPIIGALEAEIQKCKECEGGNQHGGTEEAMTQDTEIKSDKE